MAYRKKSQKPSKKRCSYYPFGLKHKGYNNAPIGPDHNYGYNGVEESNDPFGYDVLEMDFRMYDPAIARFNGIDPVTHYSQGTSVAFDNNPIFYADPSGADSETYGASDHLKRFENGDFSNGGNSVGGNEMSANPKIITEAQQENLEQNGDLSTNQGSDQEPCSKCPNKDLRLSALIMAKHAGGKAQDYYDAMDNDDFVPSIVSGNLESITLFTFLRGGKSPKKSGSLGIRFLSNLLKKVKIKNQMRTFASRANLLSGQKGTNSSIIDKYYKQMVEGTFKHFKELSAFKHNGKTIVTGGNHRMNAAIRYGIETGDSKYLNLLLSNMRYSPGNPVDYGYKVYKLIK